MIIDVLTIFPTMFDSIMSSSILGSACERGLLEFRAHDLRDWTHDRHRSTDDEPYGGGAGMVMKPEPIGEALESIQALEDEPGRIIFLTPSGRPFDQSIAQELASHDRIVLVCGRYEGFDERSLTLADDEISIGDYVLTGGEIPAMVLTDAVTRLLPGVLGDASSAEDESFTDGFLEYPQYTRPPLWRDLQVPDVLRGGNHAEIERWRRLQAVKKTAHRRPELLDGLELTSEERDLADRTRASTGSQPKED